MSELGKQLEQAQREYQQARYPGDLATDTLGTPSMRLGYATAPRRHWIFWANVGALGAVAATIAIVMFSLQTKVTITPAKDSQPSLAFQQPRDTDDFSVVPQLAGARLVPQDVNVVPTGQTAVTMPAMPSFPSLSDVMNSATTTNTNDSKEST